MHLMILENRRLVRELRPAAPQVSIGSNPHCFVHLADARIVPHLADLRQDEAGQWWLEVRDASVPTCLNRAVQKTRARLNHADEITVAQYAIRLFMESQKSREETQRERMLALTKAHEGSLALDAIIQKSTDAVTVGKEHLEQVMLLVQRLAGAENAGQLMTPVLRAVLRSCDGRRAWIGIRRADRGPFEWGMGLSDRGQPCERPAFSESMESRCLEHTQYVCSPQAPGAGVRSAMGVPLACQSGNLGMIYVENDAGDAAYDRSALYHLSALACGVSRAVENFVLQAATVRRAAVSTEQTIARLTQDALTPKALPHWDDLQLAAYRFMGASVCCDFYDVVQLADKSAWIVVARLRVEPLLTARYMAEVRAAFRAAALHNDAPHLFARALNWALYSGDARNRIDLAALGIAPRSGRMQCVLAGDAVRVARIGADGACEYLEPGDSPSLCRVKSPAYEARTLELASGQSLMIATLGAEAVRNAAGESFGVAGVAASICDGVGQSPGAVLSEFETDLKDFLGDGGACPEDVTVLLGRRM